MFDSDIRLALHTQLETDYSNDPSTRIIDELTLCQGASRIDVAVINGTLNGFEIKSDKDTLERLPTQQDIYSKVFDTVTIVVGSNHLDKVLKEVPAWWGVQEATVSPSGIVFNVIRKPDSNPTVDPQSVIQFLWKEEAMTILNRHGISKGLTRKSRLELWELIVKTLPVAEVKSNVRTCLKQRANWRSD